MVQAQDVLGLGSEARMNMPGTAKGSWQWRLREGALTADLARRLGEVARGGGPCLISRGPSRRPDAAAEADAALDDATLAPRVEPCGVRFSRAQHEPVARRP